MKAIARAQTIVFLAAALCLALASAQNNKPQWSEAAKPIVEGIGKLRSLSDTDRVAATKDLALQIRALPAGPEKLRLANGLANLSTEGDFGQDTLQAVTDTLAQAVQETPPASKDGKPASAYMELAQLNRYEHMNVSLNSPGYQEAQKELDTIDQARANADFTLNDIQGHPWTLSGLKGKVVLVNFWATWCPPCRKEMPDLDKLSAQFKDQGLVVLSISDEDLKTVQPFIQKNGYTYPILLDPGDKIEKLYSVEGIPHSFLYDRNGKLVATAMDMRTRDQFLRMLAQAGIK